MLGVDYAWDHPTIDSLRAGGYRFALRYLSRDAAKNLTKTEADRLHAAGIWTVSNWEAVADAAKRGFDQGVADARAAAAQHEACGGPATRPIYFSVDYDVPDAAPTVSDDGTPVHAMLKLGAVADYFRGVASVIGVERTGAYGGYWAIKRLLDAGLIRWGWQTFAWSGGHWDERAHVRQIHNQVTIGGADCDVDQAMAVDFGQWPHEEDDMQQDEPISGYKAKKDRRVGDVFADVSNERDWWYAPPGTDGANPPPPGSRADIVLKAAQQTLSGQAQVTQITVTPEVQEAIVTAVVDRIVKQLDTLEFKATAQ